MKNNLLVWVVVIALFVVAVVYFGIRGSAKVATAGDLVSVNYTGKLADGTVFDSNVDEKFGHVAPFQFVLGAKQVIPGWDEGLLGMKVGEKKSLVVPPEKGYGEAGVPGLIPSNATLYFDVELLEIKKEFY